MHELRKNLYGNKAYRKLSFSKYSIILSLTNYLFCENSIFFLKEFAVGLCNLKMIVLPNKFIIFQGINILFIFSNEGIIQGIERSTMVW